jgi:hypothetical protein
MRVMRILFRAGMAAELLPDFLRNAGVRKCGVEAVAQGMKREVRQRSPTARLYQFSFNPGFLQNRFKSTVRPNLPPVPFPTRDGNIVALPVPAFFNNFR